MVTTERTLLRRDEGGISILTINRPDRLNALDHTTIDAMLVALDEIAETPDLRVVVLTGSGDRAFSAGADIFGLASSVGQGPEATTREFCERGQRLTARIENYPKPIIVAVNGLAYGAGCEITEAAALAVASDRALFAKPEIDLGFAPPFGGTQRLPRLVGRKRAMAMILTGEPITAQGAADIGLVNRVVPQEQVLDEALAMARRIASKSQIAVGAALTAVTRGLNVAISEGLAIEAMQFRITAGSGAMTAAVNHFVERHSRIPGRQAAGQDEGR